MRIEHGPAWSLLQLVPVGAAPVEWTTRVDLNLRARVRQCKRSSLRSGRSLGLRRGRQRGADDSHRYEAANDLSGMASPPPFPISSKINDTLNLDQGPFARRLVAGAVGRTGLCHVGLDYL
jgi:hypothetical protein